MQTTPSNGFEFIEGLTAELSSGELIFPTSLNATMRIRHALSDPDASIDKIARIVGAEPVLSAQLLRLCNSAAYNGGNKPVADLRSAIARLGFSMVRNLAISVGMQQLNQSKIHGGIPPEIEGLWKRSIRIAALSYVLSRRLTRVNPDTAMLAGLLHDIGKFYILNRARNYSDFLTDETKLWEVIDHWHAAIGEAILQSWEIPEEISNAVRDHCDLSRTHIGPPDLADLVTAADFMDARFYADGAATIDDESLPTALGKLNLDLEKCKTLMQETREEMVLIFKAIA